MNDLTEAGGKTPIFPGIWPLAAVVGFVAFVHAAWWLLGDTVVAHGNLVDSDGYARLLRVERLLETGQWYDSSLPRANWPYGGSLHWTRLFDVLLIALALPLTPLMGQDQALYWSGAVINPLLHMVMAVVLVWAAKPLIGRAGGLIAGALTAVQFGVIGYALIGRADHHVLIGLIVVTAFGFGFRALTEAEAAARHAAAAGGVLAAGFWVGMEVQVTAGLFFLVMGLKWVFEGDGTGQGNLRHVTRLALGLAAGMVVVVLIERGAQGFFDPQYDRVSIAQLTLAGLVLLFWVVVSAAHRRGRPLASVPGRMAAALLGGAVALGATLALFPRYFINPLEDFNPVILGVFRGILEYATIQDTPHFLVYVGIVVIAGPWAVWRLKGEWPGRKRWAWLLVVASSIVYFAFALNWIRWSLYVGFFMVVPLADLIQRIDAAIDKRFAFPARSAIKIPVILLLAIGPLALGTAGIYAQGNEAGIETEITTDTDPRPCPVQALSGYLNGPPWNGRPRTILASANFGAELLYRTRHRVTATLHHTNADGIYDSIRILGGADEAEVLNLIRKRQVDLILICPKTNHDAYFLKDGGEDILYRRLERGDLPGWIRETALPAGLKGRFRMFEVSPPVN